MSVGSLVLSCLGFCFIVLIHHCLDGGVCSMVETPLLVNSLLLRDEVGGVVGSDESEDDVA